MKTASFIKISFVLIYYGCEFFVQLLILLSQCRHVVLLYYEDTKRLIFGALLEASLISFIRHISLILLFPVSFVATGPPNLEGLYLPL